MSCEVCNGRPGCPVCGPEPELEKCHECNGIGERFFNCDGVELGPEAWQRGERNDIIRETCEECNGTGEVLTEKDEYAF
ncbi:hypothetical protein [Anaerophaga thermohalophila]|jgi:DnaJ-class molecular chaperone|uniref:hypothetical protein n=1 Tax=Anaerophaga thermohalophila TaxID=177400 RepID=UPI000237C832|nr:hypothetical protein [Anaerophaga thermohalophila]